MKPKLLDLFCCAGGATRGYQLAGFHVTGVDLNKHPDYCGDDFIQGDAIEYALAHAHEYDFTSASPPCQFFSTITPDSVRGEYPNLIAPTRAALEASGKPYVIENVMPAVRAGFLSRDVMLCGEMFGLRVIKHRAFELGGWTIDQPTHPKHRGRAKGSGRACRGNETEEFYYFSVYGTGGGKGTVAEWQDAMGMDWTEDRHLLAEAIPPAYTKFLGENWLPLRG